MAVLFASTAVYFFRFYEAPPDVAAAGSGYWVSTKGDDDGSGTADRPWRTVDHAVGAAPAGSRFSSARARTSPSPSTARASP